VSWLKRLVDYSPSLRSSKAEAVARITAKSFVKNAGFGDCPMEITYEFSDSNGQTIIGKHIGTESNYFGVNVGDEILIRYLESNSVTNAPKDTLGIISRIKNTR